MSSNQQRTLSEYGESRDSQDDDKQQQAEDSNILQNNNDIALQRQTRQNIKPLPLLSECEMSASCAQRDTSNWRVKKLTDICLAKCINNFQAVTTLGSTDKCYFRLVEPILLKMGSQQLRSLEQNSYTELKQDTPHLWKSLIQKDFPKYRFDDINGILNYNEIYYKLENELNSRRHKALENLKKSYEKHQSLKQSKSAIALNESASIKLINLTILKKRKRKLFTFESEFKSPAMKKLRKDVQKQQVKGPPTNHQSFPTYERKNNFFSSDRLYQSSFYNSRPTLLNKIKHDTTNLKRGKFTTSGKTGNSGTRSSMSHLNKDPNGKFLKKSSLFDNPSSSNAPKVLPISGPIERPSRSLHSSSRPLTNKTSKKVHAAQKKPEKSPIKSSPSSLFIPRKSKNSGVTINSNSTISRTSSTIISKTTNDSNGQMVFYDPHLIANTKSNIRGNDNTETNISRNSPIGNHQGTSASSKNGKHKLIKSSLFK